MENSYYMTGRNIMHNYTYLWMYGKNTITDLETIANAFNNYFDNVGATLASKIPDQGVDFSVYMPPANECSLFLTPASENEVKRVIANLNDGSPGKDGVTAKNVKNCLRCSDHTYHPSGKSVIYTGNIPSRP